MKGNDIMQSVVAEAPSYEAWLAKMDTQLWTFGWDVLLAFDRGVTNILLMQEFIDRLDGEDHFPIIPNHIIPMEGGAKHALIGFQMGKPRLSFENASIKGSKAKLTIRLTGGKQVKLTEIYHGGQPVRSITRLSVINAAAGPSLFANIELNAVPGTADESGKVLIDISKGVDYLFSGVDTLYEKTELGIHLKKILDKWNALRGRLTTFQLSELKKSADSLLQPGNFGIRTHAVPGSTVRESAEYGNGAVLVFAAMQGSPNGTWPAEDKDLLYMLPKATEPYTSNLLLGHKLLIDKILLEAINGIAWLNGKMAAKLKPGSEFRRMLESTGSFVESFPGVHEEDGGGLGSEEWWAWLKADSTSLPMLMPGAASFYLDKGKVVAQWRVKGEGSDLDYYNSGGKWGTPVKRKIKISSNIDFDAVYAYKMKREGENTILVMELESFTDRSGFSIDYNDSSGSAKRMANRAFEKLKPAVMGIIDALVDQVRQLTIPIDALRLNNLLFQGDNVVTPRTVNVPADLSLLGNLAPDRTTLVISPAEVIVAGGRKHKFEAKGASGTVDWTVENLPGETGDKGTITGDGTYTAPSAGSLREDGQRRVQVVAKNGQLTSKALVSLVENEVSIYPLVASVNLGNTHTLSASTPDGAALTWDELPEGLGKVTNDSDTANPGGQIYTAPVMLPKRQSGEPLYYYGLRHVPITVKPTAGGTAAIIDMLVLGAKSQSYWLEADPKADGSVAVEFYTTNRDGETLPVTGDVEWTLVKGDGTFINKVYTPKSGSSEQYAIIVAFSDDGGSSDKFDVLILPVPFISLKRYGTLLDPQVMEIE